MSGLLIAAIIWPFFVGALLAAKLRSRRVQKAGLFIGALGIVAIAVSLIVSVLETGPVSTQIGGWQSGMAIRLNGDALAAVMLTVSSIVGLSGALFAIGDPRSERWSRGYATYYLVLLGGVNGAFLTADLFNLFVWFEVILMASFCLLVVSRGPSVYRGAIKYVALNVLSSFFFLSAVGLIYGKLGTVDMAEIAIRLSTAEHDGRLLSSAGMLFLAFAVKAGAFPLYFWLPPAYPQAGFATVAVFGGLLTKVGVYAIFRVFGGVLQIYHDTFAPILIILGSLTMIMGALAAMSQMTLRRILSFHVISQVGYLLVGIGLCSASAFAAVVYYVIHHVIVKANLFLAAGLMARSGQTEDIRQLGGLLRQRPVLAGLFLVPAFSLAGIPPFSGFFAKFFMLEEAVRAESYGVLAIMIAVGFVTMYSMIKVWDRSFWEKPTAVQRKLPISRIQMAGVLLLALLSVCIGMGVGPIYEVAQSIGQETIGGPRK